MSRTDAELRQLAQAVEDVRRADAAAHRAVQLLSERVRRGAITTTAAIGLGVAAVAALASPRPRPAPAKQVRSGLIAAVLPFALDFAVRQLTERRSAVAATRRPAADQGDERASAWARHPR